MDFRVPVLYTLSMLSFYTKMDKNKRIRFLRKAILTAVALSCLIPTCICVILAIRYDRSQTRLKQASEDIAWYREHYGEKELEQEDTVARKFFDAANVVLAAESEEKEEPGKADADKEKSSDVSDDTMTEDEKEPSESSGEGDSPETDAKETVVYEKDPEDDDGAEGTEGNDGEEAGETPADEGADKEEWDGIRRIYLTFDDGPSSSTSDILDILDEYGVKATFFVTGKEDSYYQPIYKRIVDDGHTLGMHSFSHKYSEVYASLDGFQTDLHKLQTFLYESTGVWSKLYRFPGGSSNTVSKVDMEKLAKYLELEGIVYYDWNIACGDDRAGTTMDQLISNVISGVPRYHSCVILMHDAADKKNTVEALPEIIKTIQGMENTEFLPITDTTEIVRHRDYR